MTAIANTPAPPYYAVIFTSVRTEAEEGYAEMAARMVELASRQPGFLGMESVRQDMGITVSYWKDLDAIRAWKSHAEHLQAQHLGRSIWYSAFKTRICKVERDYSL